MKTFLQLMRVREWVKNLFVFLPLVFGGGLLSQQGLLSAVWVFLCFSLAASSIYIINDLNDRETDRMHPLKRNRPIAAGRVSPALAGGISAALACISLSVSNIVFDTFASTATIGAYLVLNLLYTYRLKRIAIIDVMTIALGFVLRILAGGAACGIWVSPWLIVMVFLLTLFIAFGKRRDDLMRMDRKEDSPRRESVMSYTPAFVDQTMSMLAGAMIVAYCIYTLSPDVEARFNSRYVFVTAIFVIAGLLRYLQITLVKKESGDPTAIACHDRFIITCCLLWLLSFIVIIYF